tara:strand:- start:748 stop:1083 length:336 start_codon:yes stop_codon:yes gene_type:complete
MNEVSEIVGALYICEKCIFNSRDSVQATKHKLETDHKVRKIFDDEVKTRLPLRVCVLCGTPAYTDEDMEGFVKKKESLNGRSNRCKSCDKKQSVIRRIRQKEKKRRAREYI